MVDMTFIAGGSALDSGINDECLAVPSDLPAGERGESFGSGGSSRFREDPGTGKRIQGMKRTCLQSSLSQGSCQAFR
jgi:hypothetical protein